MAVYVRADGCIQLGRNVCSDGFVPDTPYRVQTHAHHDHLKDFERSKGAQSIIMSEPTLELLIAEFNADLPHRTNISTLPADGNYYPFGDVQVALFPSGHLVGGIIPAVEDAEVGLVAYAADFSWPLEKLPTGVDTLVVDATYGDATFRRNYTQDDVVNQFLELVRDELREGRVVFTGHRGRLQYAAQLLANVFDEPFIFTRHAKQTLDVFMKHRGFSLEALEFSDRDAHDILASGDRCLVFAESRDRLEIDQLSVDRRIYLSPFMCPREKPVAIYDTLVRVALTDHADFDQTMELIRAVNPARVIADNSRGGNATALAASVKGELGIDASAEIQKRERLWGLG